MPAILGAVIGGLFFSEILLAFIIYDPVPLHKTLKVSKKICYAFHKVNFGANRNPLLATNSYERCGFIVNKHPRAVPCNVPISMYISFFVILTHVLSRPGTVN